MNVHSGLKPYQCNEHNMKFHIKKTLGNHIYQHSYKAATIPCVECTLPAQYTDRVDLKDGLLNNRVCTVKFPVVESYFLCNTTQTEQAINQNGPGGLLINIL